jgi:hypothetical protein
MARMLAALRKTERQPPPPETILLAPVCASEDDVSVEPVSTEEIPFIEVGGRGSPLDASPSVLAATPKFASPIIRFQPVATPQPPVLAVETAVVAFRPVNIEPPSERFAAELVTFHKPDDPVTRQFRVLVRELEGTLLTEAPAVLVFVTASAVPTAIDAVLNAAIVAAAERRVIVTESVPSGVAERLGLRAFPGLADVVAHRITLVRAVQPSGLGQLDVLTAGRITEDDPPPSAAAIRTVLAALRGRGERIYVCAPAGEPAALQPWLLECDSAYLILPTADADAPRGKELMRQIRKLGGPLQGCILIAA